MEFRMGIERRPTTPQSATQSLELTMGSLRGRRKKGRGRGVRKKRQREKKGRERLL